MPPWGGFSSEVFARVNKTAWDQHWKVWGEVKAAMEDGGTDLGDKMGKLDVEG